MRPSSVTMPELNLIRVTACSTTSR